MLHDLGEKRRRFLIPSRSRVSLRQHELGAIGIELRIAANHPLEVRQSSRRLPQRHQAQPAPVKTMR